MITVSEFRTRVRNNELEELLEQQVLSEGALHVTAENIEYLQESLALRFGASGENVKVWIVGSAKLGFSLTEKNKDGVNLKRYRNFSPGSDIDVAVVSPPIFSLIWNELSTYAHRTARLPWDSRQLGDYMVCGWLRPDHFPKNVRLRHCDDWWDLFARLSADRRYGRRRVRGGLFHSVEHMKQYQIRALRDCFVAENLES